LNIRKEPL